MRSTFIDQTPVRMGTPEQFACIVRTLKRSSFDEETICRVFKLDNMSDVGSITESDVELSDISPQLQVLIRLFLLPSLLGRAEVEAVFDQGIIDSFLALGLLGTGEFGNDQFYVRALLYPVAGFFIASDRHSMPDGSEFEPPPDIVFPAIFSGTLRFLQLMPSNWNGAALDLCSGTGIGALVLGGSGKIAVSTDITERAVTFARFNCALNNIQNVEVFRGDLYEAVEGRTFGCIVAHPPYVPSLEAKAIWRDGGTTGESLVRRIVEGLPEHLDPGGIFFCFSLGVDTENAKFEERVRLWLGHRADEFDIIFAYQEVREPRQVLDVLARKHPGSALEFTKTLESEFERAGVVKMPFGALCLMRSPKPATRHPLTVRRQLTAETDGSDFEKAFVMHHRFSQPNFLTSLEQAAPQLAPRLEVKVTQVVNEGSLVPADFLFEIDKPFEARARFEPWMVPLLTRLDGKTSLANIYDEARAKDEIPEDFKLENLAVLVARTLEMGYTLLP
ncbi:MAG TPA: hypothetical protein DHU55_02320 [Blastocatellia bacterium]|jgi:SAM-dependent methyltransferase|nr:hypothetical protein [Blastocatellia bacterium]